MRPNSSPQLPRSFAPHSRHACDISSPGAAFMRSISSMGTSDSYWRWASGPKSRTERPTMPNSFSTCTASSVSRSGSSSRSTCIMAQNARLSASSVSPSNVDRLAISYPSCVRTRGKRSWSSLTQRGTYFMWPFFQVPNHSITSLRSRSRAALTIWRTMSRSNWPSTGSMRSHATAMAQELELVRRHTSHTGSSCSIV